MDQIRRRSWNKIGFSFLAASIVMLGVPLVAVGAPTLAGPGAVVSAAQPCPTYEFLGARGSGQTYQLGQDGMGPEVFDAFNDLQKLLPSGVTMTPYGVGGVGGAGYPAVNTFPTSSPTALLSSLRGGINGTGAVLHLGFLGSYTASVQSGTSDVIGHIDAFHLQCASTRFILSGYSQGAQVVGDAIQRMPAADQSLIAAAALFGDPYFNATSFADRSVSASPFDPTHYGLLGVRPEFPSSLHGDIFSFCHDHDPICNISQKIHILGDGDVFVRDWFDISPDQHATPAYVNEGDTQQAANDIGQVLGFSTSTNFSGPVDIAFAIDSTGSMGDVIGLVQSEVTALVNGISAIDPNLRVGLVDYKDDPANSSPYQARVDTDFTTNISTFTTAVNSLSADGGGDTPESVYDGIVTALGLHWRAGVKKIVIQIGDAPAKDPEPVTGYTLQSVVNAALAVDPAVVDTVQPGNDPATAASLQSIASATGGTYIDLPNRADLSALVPDIESEVTSNLSAPVANLAGPATGTVGSPVDFSAGASTDSSEPIVSYKWDFNNDGIYDLTTTDPVASFTYGAPYSGDVVVEAVSKSGLTSLASTAISVVPPPTGPPSPPTNLQGQSGDGNVTLTWGAAPSGPTAEWFTITDQSGNVIDTVAAQPDGTAPPSGWEENGLTNGTAYQFKVSAGSEVGQSAAIGPITVTPEGSSTPQTITFAPPSSGIAGKSATLTATATSGLPVTFGLDPLSGTGVCSVSGAVVQYLKPGACVIDANQAGNTTYAAAPQVSGSIKVTTQVKKSCRPDRNGTSSSEGSVTCTCRGQDDTDRFAHQKALGRKTSDCDGEKPPAREDRD